MRVTMNRQASPSESLGQAMGAVGPAFTLSHLWRAGRPSMSGARSSMPSSTCCAAAVRGDCCPTICRPGAPPTGTSDAGATEASGIRSYKSCAWRCASSKAEILSRVRPSLIVNPSKPARFVAPRKATTRGKKIWGRKRHLLVDTQGHLLTVKVTGAHQSDQQGAKTLLEPVKELFPKIKLLWGDSHYGGTLIGWLKEHLGWTIVIVRRLKAPQRGLLVPRSAPRWSGRNSFPQAFVRCPEDGWWRAALPASP